MQIQINSDKNIQCHEVLSARFRSVVEDALRHLSTHITRVEVHLSDENSNKKRGLADMRCMMEARLEGRQPIAVTCQADTVDQALTEAAHKLTRSIETIIERIHDQHIHGKSDPMLHKVQIGEK